MNQEKAENEDQMIEKIKTGKDKLWAKDKVKFDVINVTNAFIDLSNIFFPWVISKVLTLEYLILVHILSWIIPFTC